MTHTKKKLAFECLESRFALATTAVEYGDIGYFFNSESNIVQRYNIAHENWIEAIALQNTSSGPLVVHVDADGIFAAFDRSVYRYQSDGDGKTHLINLRSPVVGIHSDGNLLLLDFSNSSHMRWVTINKLDNAVIDSMDSQSYQWGMFTCSIAPTLNAILCRSISGPGWSLSRTSYNDHGMFLGTVNSSSYESDYSVVSKIWVTPDDSRILDDAGNLFSTAELRFINRLSHLDDVGFLEDQLLFAQNGTEITAYNKAYLPTGMRVLTSPANKIFVSSSSVIAFFEDPTADRGYRTQILLVASFNPADPNQPIDPTGLAYTPDWTEVTNQGRVLIWSKLHRNVFVWNPMEHAYQRSIGLLGSPIAMAYDRVTDLIYVAYESGLIYKINLQSSDPIEMPFAKLPGRPQALAIASDYLFLADRGPSDYNYLNRVLSQDGSTLSTWSFYYSAQGYLWNATNRRIYFIQAGGYPTALFSQEIGDQGILKSPITASYLSSVDLKLPIRISSDGAIVLLASGTMYDANTLKQLVYSLSNTITDAVWFSGRWVTVRSVAGVAQLQEWLGRSFEPRNVMQWSDGVAFSIHQLTSKRVVVIHIPTSGIPAFTILDQNLKIATVNNTWHNHNAPMDVDDDEFVSPLDILIMIDQINQYGSRQTVNVGEHYCDVDDDGAVTPLDVLAVINWINIQEANESKQSAESHSLRVNLLLSLGSSLGLVRKSPLDF